MASIFREDALERMKRMIENREREIRDLEGKMIRGIELSHNAIRKLSEARIVAVNEMNDLKRKLTKLEEK